MIFGYARVSTEDQNLDAQIVVAEAHRKISRTFRKPETRASISAIVL